MDDYARLCEAVRLDVYRNMADRGYLKAVTRAGSVLERWRDYLEEMGHPGRSEPANPLIQPTIFPVMRTLRTPPWRDPQDIEATAVLETAAEVIREELDALDPSQFLQYPTMILSSGRWSVLPIFVFGEPAARLLGSRNAFPQTTRILSNLPGGCCSSPLADALFSAHAPHTRLVPHCSWDPFRLRLHLGLHVPEKCGIRVGSEARGWKEGKILAFHDAFEHETWNESEEQRVVLIADLWHPDLTASEQMAILACTRKKEVRSALMKTRAPPSLQPLFERRFAEAERLDPLVARFWEL